MRPLTIKFLLRKLARLTVDEAVWLLKVYRQANADFCLQGQTGTLYATTPKTLFSDWHWIKPHDPACTLPVRFLGGPVHKAKSRDYYGGTLVTLLVDRVCLVWQMEAIGYAWLLKFDPNSAVPIWHQLKEFQPKQLHPEPPPQRGPKQKLLFDNDEQAGHYEPNPVTEYVEVRDTLIPLHEDGTQGYDMPRAVHPHSLGYDQPPASDDYKVYAWSSTGRTGVSV